MRLITYNTRWICYYEQVSFKILVTNACTKASLNHLRQKQLRKLTMLNETETKGQLQQAKSLLRLLKYLPSSCVISSTCWRVENVNHAKLANEIMENMKVGKIFFEFSPLLLRK